MRQNIPITPIILHKYNTFYGHKLGLWKCIFTVLSKAMTISRPANSSLLAVNESNQFKFSLKDSFMNYIESI